jgi:hypothetical protein
MTRDQWIAHHVARAPKITLRQWADTLLLLQLAKQEHENETSEED